MINLTDLYLLNEIQEDPGIQHPTNKLDIFLKITNSKDIMWSPKLDGIKCRTEINKQTIKKSTGFTKIATIKYFSSNYNEIPNFKVFNDDIIEICHVLNREFGIKYPIRLDGEGASKSKRLSHIMTQFRRVQNMDPTQFQLHLFDIAIENMPFSRRHFLLKEAIKKVKSKKIFLLPYEPFLDFNEEKLYKLVDIMYQKGYEGVILQDANAEYVGGDTTISIKVKKLKDIDLKIVGINIGTEGKFKNMLSTFICDYNGKYINISGKLSINERIYYAKNPPINKVAEIKYTEETSTGSLRDPVFVRLRDDKSIVEVAPEYDVKKDNSINNHFVIQQHQALRAGLHYDLRLGKDGVLKSWATRKIPELISNEVKKIILFKTPDHDASWAFFKGTIAEGYGKGKVKIWDKGTYREIYWSDDHITVEFNGSKIKGKFTFILYKAGKESQWLMFKSK